MRSPTPSKLSMNRALKVISLLTILVASGCSEYDTDTIGQEFAPVNSLVSQFVHPVYVEYREGGVRIWGPYSDVVSANADGARLSITSADDSLALFVYGNAVGDSLNPLDGQLRIDIDRDFALYLNGLSLHSTSGPAIEVQADDHICYIVVTAGSTNALSDTIYQTQYRNGAMLEADGCLYVSGQLYFDGRGTLSVRNAAPARWDADWGDSIYTHALYARGGMVCNYALTANLTSLHGDAIHTAGAEVKLVKGTWNLYPARDTINSAGAEIAIGAEAKLYVNDSLWIASADTTIVSQ